MKIIPYDKPEELREYLTNHEWGYQLTNHKITAVFCPLCSAMVALPIAQDIGWSPRAHHINFHVEQSRFMKQHIDKITELQEQLKTLKRGPQLHA